MHKTPIFHYLFVLFAIALTSCITTRQTNYLQKGTIFVPAQKDTLSYQDYKLKETDRLFVQVYSMDPKTNALFNGGGSSMGTSMMGLGENSDLYTYVVQADGSIQFPLIGKVYVGGKTIREAKEVIELGIKPILETNSVDVRMVNRSFSILGAGKSGRFNFPREKVNIYQALAMAGDLGFYADRSKVKILREVGDSTQIKVFDIRGIDIINSEFYYLEPNDIIFLQPLKQQFFGVSSLWSAISTAITSYSFGVVIYKSFFETSSSTTSE